jgi:malonyl-CoA O-methyltransferase
VTLNVSRLSHALRRRLPIRTLSSPAAYALWAATYPPTAHNPLMHIEQTAMLSLLPGLNGLDVLDLACGSGRYALIASQQGARRVEAVDNSVAMLQRGRTDAALPAPIQADLDAIPFGTGSFDGVICALATGHLPPDRMQSAVSEAARVLRPGGWLVLSDFHPFLYLNGGKRTFNAINGRRWAVTHYPHLMADYFVALTQAGLSLDALIEPVATNGTPAVLALRARK